MILLVILSAFTLSVLAVPVTQFVAEEVARDFHEACRRAGVTKDQIARRFGISAPQLDAQLKGQGHLSVPRLYMLRDDQEGRRFLYEYAPVIAKSWGVPELEIALRFCALTRAMAIDIRELFRDVMLGVVNHTQKHMAQAQLRDHADDEGVA